jgi:hypothetical protein
MYCILICEYLNKFFELEKNFNKMSDEIEYLNKIIKYLKTKHYENIQTGVEMKYLKLKLSNYNRKERDPTNGTTFKVVKPLSA